MSWIEGQGIPYDGFYNGNVKMMILNGTFADFLPIIERTVKKGKYSRKGTLPERVKASEEMLEAWKKEWEEIPLPERIRLRDRVADDVEPKPVTMMTVRGPMQFFRAKPSSNNNLDKRTPQLAKQVKKRLPSGAITRDSNPLVPLRLSPA